MESTSLGAEIEHGITCPYAIDGPHDTGVPARAGVTDPRSPTPAWPLTTSAAPANVVSSLPVRLVRLMPSPPSPPTDVGLRPTRRRSSHRFLTDDIAQGLQDGGDADGRHHQEGDAHLE